METGWLKPQTNGNYRFYLASDDACELWLSATEYAAHKTRITAQGGYAGVRQWNSPSAYFALEAGKRLPIADARTPNDYVTKHIRGAVSVPFYEPEKYLDRLPKDVTIVTYCGCPHAASGALADSLKERGYSRVWVLDEGYFVWRDSGYAVTEGVAP